MTVQDSAIAEQWAPPSWEQIVRDHADRVFRLAYRLTGNRQDAEDLTQDVFIRVFRSLHTFTPGNFDAWIHRITTNLFLDLARRRQKIRFEGLPDDTERVEGKGVGPADAFDATELDPELQAALDALRPEYRVAVVLCDVEGMTYEEIADVLGVKLGTVRSRIHRGRTQMRETLAGSQSRLRRRPGIAMPGAASK